MSRVAQHEGGGSAHHLGRSVGPAPRRQVVVDGAGDELRYVDGGHVQRGVQEGPFTSTDQRVVREDVQELAVQLGREVRAVGVPGQDVEHGRVLAEQVVVHPVVPHQVVGPHPGKHTTHAPRVDDALAPRVPIRE